MFVSTEQVVGCVLSTAQIDWGLFLVGMCCSSTRSTLGTRLLFEVAGFAFHDKLRHTVQGQADEFIFGLQCKSKQNFTSTVFPTLNVSYNSAGIWTCSGIPLLPRSGSSGNKARFGRVRSALIDHGATNCAQEACDLPHRRGKPIH